MTEQCGALGYFGDARRAATGTLLLDRATATGAPVCQRLGAMLIVVMYPPHYGLGMASRAFGHLGGTITLGDVVKGEKALAAPNMGRHPGPVGADPPPSGPNGHGQRATPVRTRPPWENPYVETSAVPPRSKPWVSNWTRFSRKTLRSSGARLGAPLDPARRLPSHLRHAMVTWWPLIWTGRG